MNTPRSVLIAIGMNLAVCLTWLPSCTRTPVEVQPIEIQVGVHHLALLPPTGWQHADHGREHLYQRGPAKISLVDLGPVDRDGYLREVERARALFRSGQSGDAAWRLKQLRIDRREFAVPEDYQKYAALRREATKRETYIDAVRIEQVYDELIAVLEALPKPDIADLAMAALEEFGYDELRGIASRKPLLITGRPALQIDTWHRLTHQLRKRYVLVLNGGHLLVVRTAYGPFDECETAFDGIVRSLEFKQAPAA